MGWAVLALYSKPGPLLDVLREFACLRNIHTRWTGWETNQYWPQYHDYTFVVVDREKILHTFINGNFYWMYQVDVLNHQPFKVRVAHGTLFDTLTECATYNQTLNIKAVYFFFWHSG